jgi:pilus assembly protein Flp/PilA
MQGGDRWTAWSGGYSCRPQQRGQAAAAEKVVDSRDKGGELKMLSNLYLRLRELTERAQERITNREEGQGMVEYALILVLIAVVVIVILTVVGRQVNNVFSNISNGLNQ